jgi:cell division septation protein DedD
MTDDSTSIRQTLNIEWVRVAGGALAAVASAVVLSTLGAAGTLIGAALGSVIATVAGTVFTQGLSTSKEKLAQAQASALHKVGVAQAEVRRAGRVDDTRAQESHLRHADRRLAQAREELDDAARAAQVGGPSWRDRFAQLPWRRIAVLSLGVFLGVVVLITAFEVVAGRSVASITGGSGGGDGTTITNLGGGSGSTRQEQPSEGTSPSPTPTQGTSPSESPSESPTPSQTPSPTDTATGPAAATPTPAPESTPSLEPTAPAVTTPAP